MTFPARREVQWYSFDPSGTTVDDLGNDKQVWLPPVTRKVIGWIPSTSVKFGEFVDRATVDVMLLVPPAFTFNRQDRVDLPDDTDNLYWVVGIDDYTNATLFVGWKPPAMLKLKLVEG